MGVGHLGHHHLTSSREVGRGPLVQRRKARRGGSGQSCIPLRAGCFLLVYIVNNDSPSFLTCVGTAYRPSPVLCVSSLRCMQP